MVDGTAFTVVQKKKVVAAGAPDIEQIVTQNLYTRFGKRRQSSLSATSSRLLMIANSFPALSIAYRIDQLLDRTPLSKLNHSFESPEHSKALEKAVMGPEATAWQREMSMSCAQIPHSRLGVCRLLLPFHSANLQQEGSV